MKFQLKCAHCGNDTSNISAETGLDYFGEKVKLWVNPTLCNKCWDETEHKVCSRCDMEAACNGPAIEQCYRQLDS